MPLPTRLFYCLWIYMQRGGERDEAEKPGSVGGYTCTHASFFFASSFFHIFCFFIHILRLCPLQSFFHSRLFVRHCALSLFFIRTLLPARGESKYRDTVRERERERLELGSMERITRIVTDYYRCASTSFSMIPKLLTPLPYIHECLMRFHILHIFFAPAPIFPSPFCLRLILLVIGYERVSFVLAKAFPLSSSYSMR